MTYAARMGAGRTMLWVPGLVRVMPGGAAQIDLGPGVGWTDFGGIEDWKCSVQMVPRAACVARGLPLPEASIDAGRYPHVYAAARAAPYVAVLDEEASACAAAGYRAVEVGWHRVSGGGLLRGYGGGPERAFGGELAWALPDDDDRELEAGSDEDLERQLRRSYTVMIDRIVRAVSDDAVTGEEVELAQSLASIVRPEAVRWSRPSRADAELADLRLMDWNERLAQVFERAEAQRADAEALVAALAAAPGDVAVVPVYGRARRVRLPARDIDRKNGTLHLPEFAVWVVADVAVWIPDTGQSHAAELLRMRGDWPPRPQQTGVVYTVSPALAVVVVIVIVLAVLIALTRR